ncbi:MAG: FadR/GntR family transcriptional regulator [Streptosporangiaceae bacterium]
MVAAAPMGARLPGCWEAREQMRAVDSAAAAGRSQSTHEDRGLRLAERILSSVGEDGPAHDSRLPTERQLSIDLGVTRSSIRHALAILEAQGRISREVGRGTFLRERPVADGQPGGSAGPQPRPLVQAVRAAGDFAPADVMTIRRLLEPPAMPLVVAWATASDLEEMDRCLAGGDRAASFEEFESWDLALHNCIMAASHSPLLIALYGVIEQARHGHVWGDLKRRSASAERRADYQADHRAIVDALRARDSAAAVEAMRRHLARVQEHLNVTDPAAGVSWG